jgi:hypothetical protein
MNGAIPMAPANLNATLGDQQVSLYWTASPQATSYSIYRRPASATEQDWGLIYSQCTATSFTDTGLTNGSPYCYVVRAINASAEESDPSNEVSATPQASGVAGSTITAEMAVRLLGYSERGMVNALCDDMAHSLLPVSAVSSFLSWFDFPNAVQPDFSNIENATLLVEQSFSDFGDLDLLILVKNKDQLLQAVLIEAKVSNDTSSWVTVEDRWAEFLGMFDGGGDWNTSNLFVQLHRKVRLVDFLPLLPGQFDADLFVPRGSLGQNAVVRRAVDELKKYIKDGNVWFGAILPDAASDLEAFSRDTLRTSSITERLPRWNTNRWGFLSWQTIEQNTKQVWPRTRDAFKWNRGQVYRPEPPVQHAVQFGQVYLHGETKVYIVLRGHGVGCRVVELTGGDRNFFWKTIKVNVTDLRPCEGQVQLADVPVLPLNASTYTWDCRDDSDKLPPDKNPVKIEPGTPVTVVEPSWYTSRVRMADAPDGQTFRVYTHHLKRQT